MAGISALFAAGGRFAVRGPAALAARATRFAPALGGGGRVPAGAFGSMLGAALPHANALLGPGNVDRALNALRSGKWGKAVSAAPPDAVQDSEDVKRSKAAIKKANQDHDNSPPGSFKRGETKNPAREESKKPERGEDRPGGPPAWLTAAGRKAYDALSAAERRRFDDTAEDLSQAAKEQMDSLLDRGTLGKKDADGLSVLEKLYGASRIPLHPLAAGEGVTNRILVERLVDDLANPGKIRQASEAGCVWANVKEDLAASDPQQYLDLATALYTRGRVDIPGIDPPVTLDGIPDDGLLADSGGSGVDLGNLHQLFPARRVLEVKGETDAASAMDALRSAIDLGEAVPVVVDNGDGTAHMITVKGIEAGTVTFFDPLSPGKLEKIAEDIVKARVSAVLPKRRFKVKNLREVKHGDGRKVAGGRLWRMGPSRG
jgi:hypothetical protein